MKKYTIGFLFVLCFIESFGQDFTFSQFNESQIDIITDDIKYIDKPTLLEDKNIDINDLNYSRYTYTYTYALKQMAIKT